jgi:hypothetical protein
VNFKIVVLSMMLTISSYTQAMESVIEMLPTVARVAVPIVSVATLYNSCNTDTERSIWLNNYIERGETEKANRFRACCDDYYRGKIKSMSLSTWVSFASLVFYPWSYVIPDDKIVLGITVITSATGYALQKYNRAQLDHAKKLAANQPSAYNIV